jgi:rSAM/selenodomain-associated transferase 2/rSAM/selenodomain-associated transferase 1
MQRLVLFTRHPEPGKTKTRLIPALGPGGAAELQRRMAERAFGWGRDLARRGEVELEVRFQGGDARAMKRWLGRGARFVPQGAGDLGARMARAMRDGFAGGATRLVIIGADVPSLAPRHVERALAALDYADLVLGPASDGGYYLIATRRPIPAIFDGIDWGSRSVWMQTLEKAAALRLEVERIEPLHDVDRPEDLPAWDAALAADFAAERPVLTPGPTIPNQPPAGPNAVPQPASAGSSGCPRLQPGVARSFLNILRARFSALLGVGFSRPTDRIPAILIIIPALNEEGNLPAALVSARHPAVREIVVTDGGSADRTVEIAERMGARVVRCAPGRGGQLRAGASAATAGPGDALLFLHADTRLPLDFPRHVARTLARPGTACGAFRLCIDAPGATYRLFERAINLRARLLGLPYGDHAFFLRRETYEKLGGFPDIPIMEDVAFIRAARRLGRIRIAPACVRTSARRWQRLGPWRTTLRNLCYLFAYFLGASPAKLAAQYRKPTNRANRCE